MKTPIDAENEATQDSNSIQSSADTKTTRATAADNEMNNNKNTWWLYIFQALWWKRSY